MVWAKLETWDELKAISLFHVIGFGLELFKTSDAIRSWSYPDFAYTKVSGVPLFSGFMYAAVGSYIIQSSCTSRRELRMMPATSGRATSSSPRFVLSVVPVFIAEGIPLIARRGSTALRYSEQMKPLERLGEARTPNGTLLTLYRHDGAYLIRADGVELMSTRRHLSEDRLAEVACAPLQEVSGARVLIGGLGLGFTLRAALRQLRDDAEVVVAELVPEVVEWNADPHYDLSAEAMADPRVRVVNDDVSNVLRSDPGGFNAIMLDTDNGPEGMLMSENARLYATYGIALTIAALRTGGSIVYWSVGDDPKFARALRGRGLDVSEIRVRAHDTSGPMHTLYVAVPRRNV